MDMDLTLGQEEGGLPPDLCALACNVAPGFPGAER